MFDVHNPYAPPPLLPDPYWPQYALDELAAALHVVRGRPAPRVILRSTQFAAQLAAERSLQEWQHLARILEVRLPDCSWESVFDAADFLATQRPDWEPPHERTFGAWINAQIFAGVRDVLVDAGAEKHKIHRGASFVSDLGFV